MDRRDYQASCAVCQGPADPDCASGCESARLNMCISNAENQWLETWREKTREWVANHAIRYVTSTFQKMKDVRLANHSAYIKALPHWDIYEQYHGRPPLHPHHINELRRRIRDADEDLRRSIDADWRQCVIRYPEVLTHYYSLISINMLKEPNPPSGLIVVPPTFLPQKPPLERARSTTGTSTTKKSRRNSKTASTKGDFSIEAITKVLQEAGLTSGGATNGHSGGALAGLRGYNPGGASAGLSSGLPSNGLPAGLQGGPGGFSGGLPAGLSSGLSGGYFDKSSGIPGLSSAFAGLNGLNDLSALNSHPGLHRTTSKAGRTTPVQESNPARPGGKKRLSSKVDDYMSGRATAPLPYPPFAPPPQNWHNSRHQM